MRFNSNISTLEERVDLATLTMDELHQTLTGYEMGIEKDNQVTKEAYKKTKKKEMLKEKSDSSDNDISEDDEEVANFVKRMKKGSRKYS